MIGALVLILIPPAALSEVSIDGQALFGLGYDQDATTRTQMIRRMRLQIDGEARTDSGLAFTTRLRLQSEYGMPITLNGPRLTLEAGDFRLRVGNIDGAIASMWEFAGAEPGLTDLVGQTSALRAGVDTYDNNGLGREGVILRYSANGFRVSASGSWRAGIRRQAVHVSHRGDRFTWAIGYQASNNAADKGLVVATLGYAAERGEVSVFLAREHAGGVIGASGAFELFRSTKVLVAASANATERYFGLGVEHAVGDGISLQGGVASVAGSVRADLGLRLEF